jgi:hypothetical protein
MDIKSRWKELKGWQKGALTGFLASLLFILIYSLNLLNPRMRAELDNHGLPIWGYFAIMIIFYIPIFIMVGGLIGTFIKKWEK